MLIPVSSLFQVYLKKESFVIYLENVMCISSEILNNSLILKITYIYSLLDVFTNFSINYYQPLFCKTRYHNTRI